MYNETSSLEIFPESTRYSGNITTRHGNSKQYKDKRTTITAEIRGGIQPKLCFSNCDNIANMDETKASIKNKSISVNNSYTDKYPLLSKYVESKIFDMKNENGVIRIIPGELTFKFNAETLKVDEEFQEIKILNISPSPIKILVMPRMSLNFKFSYTPTNWLVPGIPLSIRVTFKPTDPRTYCDWLRVCCAADSNLMVPIKAVPTHKNSLHIPEKINFGLVPIGERAVYKMILSPMKDEVIRFVFVIAKEVLGCEITPSQGKIEEEPVEIEISYRPSCYVTVSIPVQLYLPPLSMTPYYFTIEAHTKPTPEKSGLFGSPINENIPKKYLEIKQEESHKSTSKHKEKGLKKCEMANKSEKSSQKLFTQHKVNKYLMKKEVEPRDPDEQLGPYGLYMDEMQKAKETSFNDFMNVVNALRRDNTVAKLYSRKERLFKIECSVDEREDIERERLALWEQYRTNLNQINDSQQPIYIRQKTIKRYKEVTMGIENGENNIWEVRNENLWKLIQACRKVLVKNRMLKRLNVFKSLTREQLHELEKGMFKTEIVKQEEYSLI